MYLYIYMRVYTLTTSPSPKREKENRRERERFGRLWEGVCSVRTRILPKGCMGKLVLIGCTLVCLSCSLSLSRCISIFPFLSVTHTSINLSRMNFTSTHLFCTPNLPSKRRQRCCPLSLAGELPLGQASVQLWLLDPRPGLHPGMWSNSTASKPRNSEQPCWAAQDREPWRPLGKKRPEGLERHVPAHRTPADTENLISPKPAKHFQCACIHASVMRPN